jgi:hypothetical protein
MFADVFVRQLGRRMRRGVVRGAVGGEGTFDGALSRQRSVSGLFARCRLECAQEFLNEVQSLADGPILQRSLGHLHKQVIDGDHFWTQRVSLSTSAREQEHRKAQLRVQDIIAELVGLGDCWTYPLHPEKVVTDREQRTHCVAICIPRTVTCLALRLKSSSREDADQRSTDRPENSDDCGAHTRNVTGTSSLT